MSSLESMSPSGWSSEFEDVGTIIDRKRSRGDGRCTPLADVGSFLVDRGSRVIGHDFRDGRGDGGKTSVVEWTRGCIGSITLRYDGSGIVIGSDSVEGIEEFAPHGSRVGGLLLTHRVDLKSVQSS
jgi:hypothetical protein